MSYDTRQDYYQAQPRHGGPPPDETREEPRRDYDAPPGEEARDETSPRYDPPAWHDTQTADRETADRPATAGPSDLDAAEREPVSPQADVATPVDTDAPPQAVDTPAPAVAVGTASVEPEDEAALTVWPEEAVRDFQQRWREVQLRFVDDPQAAADEAQQLVAEALDRFSEAVTARRGELDGWRNAEGADTERMRTVVRRYRKLLDRLLEV